MKLIILDRDGVINDDSIAYIKSPDEWHAIPHSLEAIADLNHAGYRVVVATNQSGVARGYFDEATLEKIHKKLHTELAAVGGHIEEIFFCPHQPLDECECRKPKPGLLHRIQKKYPAQFSDVFFIGDSLADIGAARAVGCKPILVLTGKGQKTLADNAELASIQRFVNLAEAVKFILDKQ